MPKSVSLRKSQEFRAVYENGKRLDGRFVTVFVRSNQLACHRLGITASRKVSLRAVDRNRLKRLIRETFRLSEIAVSSTEMRYDWVINAKRSLLKVKLADSLKDFQKLISCLAIEEESNTYQAGQEKP